ncbi:MAG: hypothetical protein DMG57_10540 [Acidobacteria bacterium]|nr:MAG: hypothetical protein DMG57_10540 [Acidobacteriota bacterium]
MLLAPVPADLEKQRAWSVAWRLRPPPAPSAKRPVLRMEQRWVLQSLPRETVLQRQFGVFVGVAKYMTEE